VLPTLLARFVWCPVFYFSSGVGSGFGYIFLVYLIFAPCVVSSWSPAIQGDV
jgi:hypothetical protein